MVSTTTKGIVKWVLISATILTIYFDSQYTFFTTNGTENEL